MPPLGFRDVHAADLSQWDGAPAASIFQSLLRSITSDLGQPAASEPAPPGWKPPAPETGPPGSQEGSSLGGILSLKKRREDFLNIRADFAQGLELAPGSYHLEVSANGCSPKRVWIDLAAGEDKRLSLSLPKIMAPITEPAPRPVLIEAPPTEPVPPPTPLQFPPEKAFTNSLGMTFVLIPAGIFLMGSVLSPEEVAKRYGGEAAWYEAEHPQHQVTLSRPFYLQTTPVTQEQWRRVMGNNPSIFKNGGDDCPVEQVSWDDAQEFIRKLNQKEQTDAYRLPTEAEWEYACRAGSAGEFYFGDESRNWETMPGTVKFAGQTHPVGQDSPMPGACMTCTATSGNGARTGTGHMPLGRWSTPKDRFRRRAGCCGAVPGATVPCICVRPCATTTS